MTNVNALSNGKFYAVQILIARDLNLNPALVKLAESFLSSKRSKLSLVSLLSSEASNCVKKINK